MTTKVLVTQLTVEPGTATQGQILSLQVGANNAIIATVTGNNARTTGYNLVFGG